MNGRAAYTTLVIGVAVAVGLAAAPAGAASPLERLGRRRPPPPAAAR